MRLYKTQYEWSIDRELFDITATANQKQFSHFTRPSNTDAWFNGVTPNGEAFNYFSCHVKLVRQTSRFISSSSNTRDDSARCTDRTQAISAGAGNKCPHFSFLLVFIFNERPTRSTLMLCDQITKPNTALPQFN